MTDGARATRTTAPGGTSLDERYGRTPGRARSRRTLVIAVAAAFVVVFAAWVVWGGLDGATARVDTLDVGHRVLDDTAVEVSYQVTMPPGDAARCALEAQDETHDVVGWRIVDVPPSDQRTRRLTEVVRTSELAVTGLIYRCWPA